MDGASQLELELVAEQQRVVRDFLSRSQVRGEKAVAVARLVLAVTNAGVLLAFSRLPGQSAATTDSVMTTVGLGLASLFSFWVLTWKPRPHLNLWLTASVLVDTGLAFLVVYGDVGWPEPDYLGVLFDPSAALFILAMVATGVRLSRLAAAVGCSAMALCGVALVTLDLNQNADLALYGPVDVVTWAFYIVGAGVLAFVIAGWTKRLVHEGAEEARRAMLTRQRMGLFLSNEVAEEILKDGGAKAGGSLNQIAVLFSDLRGFTRYAENLAPEQLVEELNAYLDAMVDAIQAEQGHVDKFIGDAIMAVFSISEPRPDDPARAIRAARGMEDALAAHNEVRAKSGKPPLAHGIGIHYGPAVVGRIGHSKRLEFTVIGDVVNVASRLESATKRVGVRVLISRDAVDHAHASYTEVPPLREVQTLEVPGRERPIEVFTLADAG